MCEQEPCRIYFDGDSITLLVLLRKESDLTVEIRNVFTCLHSHSWGKEGARVVAARTGPTLWQYAATIYNTTSSILGET